MKKNKLLYVLMFYSSLVIAQERKDFNYTSKLDQVSDQWGRVELVYDILGKLSQEMHDLRIYNDSLEVPYIWWKRTSDSTIKELSCSIINQSVSGNDLYFTVKMDRSNTFNEIELFIDNLNFDYRIRVEGSMDQNKWFTLVKDYRILKFDNGTENYTFTSVKFPQSDYRYLRIKIPDGKDLQLQNVIVREIEDRDGDFVDLQINGISTIEKKADRSTWFEINLKERQPLSRIQISFADTLGFHRTGRLYYLRDSVKTEKGWFRNYVPLQHIILRSGSDLTWEFDPVMTAQLRLIAENGDNQPLTINTAKAWRYTYALIFRSLGTGNNYEMYFGNENAFEPYYDLQDFVPENKELITNVSYGEVVENKEPQPEKKALFEQKWILYLILGLVVLLIGYFAFRILLKEER